MKVLILKYRIFYTLYLRNVPCETVSNDSHLNLKNVSFTELISINKSHNMDLEQEFFFSPYLYPNPIHSKRVKLPEVKKNAIELSNH